MPTYEYRCNRCGHTFERFQAMTAAPVTVCPQCQGPATRLIGGGAAVLFKGHSSHPSDENRKSGSACNRERPCCGRDTPCEHRPCDV